SVPSRARPTVTVRVLGMVEPLMEPAVVSARAPAFALTTAAPAASASVDLAKESAKSSAEIIGPTASETMRSPMRITSTSIFTKIWGHPHEWGAPLGYLHFGTSLALRESEPVKNGD